MTTPEKRHRDNHSLAGRESRKRYKKRKRDQWVAAGFCSRCGKLPELPFKVCARCRIRRRKVYSSEIKQRRRDAGLCTACAKPNTSTKATCADCRQKVREAQRVIVGQYRAQGLCACGKNCRTVGTLCKPCWFKSRARLCGLGTQNWQLLRQLLIEQNFRCAYTNEPLILGRDATIDHKMPRTRGGSNAIENLHWVTQRVNAMKSNYSHDEFLKICAIITEQWQKKPSQLRIA